MAYLGVVFFEKKARVQFTLKVGMSRSPKTGWGFFRQLHFFRKRSGLFFQISFKKMEDDAFQLGEVESPRSGRTANIVNVTSGYSLQLFPRTPAVLELQSMAEFGRSAGLTGPFTHGVPSLSFTCQNLPLFAPTKVFIYQKGSVTQTGYNSEDQALLCAHSCAAFLSNLFKIRLRVSNFLVFNIVSISHTGRSIDLDALSELLGPICNYQNPQTARKLYGKREHSGAIVKSKVVKLTAADKARDRGPCTVVFSNGNTVIMGGCNRREIVAMMDELDEHLRVLDSRTALTVHRHQQRRNGGGALGAAAQFRSVQETIEAAQRVLDFHLS